jgi:hypothetical protein
MLTFEGIFLVVDQVSPSPANGDVLELNEVTLDDHEPKSITSLVKYHPFKKATIARAATKIGMIAETRTTILSATNKARNKYPVKIKKASAESVRPII